jgi:tRNA threonylcarbamoyladenosine biosynthesis protein TsaE
MKNAPSTEHESTSSAMTMQIAATLASSLRPGDILTLSGDLGAGKTCFVRGLARGLGLDVRAVSSPTYVLVHEYQPEDRRGLALIHIDAYRLNGSEELESIGWREILERTNVVIAIEWPERIADEIPEKHIAIQLAHGPSPDIRFISIRQ